MKIESKICGVLTSIETKTKLNALRANISGITEAQMMHFFLEDIFSKLDFIEEFAAKMDKKVSEWKSVAVTNRKEKYSQNLSKGKELRAAAKSSTKTPKATSKKATKNKQIKVNASPIAAPPLVEWSSPEED